MCYFTLVLMWCFYHCKWLVFYREWLIYILWLHYLSCLHAVYFTDIPNVLVIVSPNSTVYEGANVTFECIHDVKSTTVVNWFKHSNQITHIKSKLEYYIANITRFDGGEYSCGVMKNKQFGYGKVFINILCTFAMYYYTENTYYLIILGN